MKAPFSPKTVKAGFPELPGTKKIFLYLFRLKKLPGRFDERQAGKPVF